MYKFWTLGIVLRLGFVNRTDYRSLCYFQTEYWIIFGKVKVSLFTLPPLIDVLRILCTISLSFNFFYSARDHFMCVVHCILVIICVVCSELKRKLLLFQFNTRSFLYINAYTCHLSCCATLDTLQHDRTLSSRRFIMLFIKLMCI